GAAAADVTRAVTVTLYRQEWNNTLVHERGRYRYQTTRLLEPVGDPVAVKLTNGRGEVELTAPTGGSFVVLARDAETKAEASMSFYATAPYWRETVSRQDPEKVELMLLPPLPALPVDAVKAAVAAGDYEKAWTTAAAGLQKFVAAGMDRRAAGGAGRARPAYAVGQQPRVLVRSPFAGRLLLAVETDGVVSRQVIDMPASQVVVPVDVTDACRPNAFVTATVVRAVDPNAAWRAHRASGVVRLPVDPADRKLVARIDAPTEIRPETTLSGTVKLTDAAGRPAAGAAVTVAAVDEGILQLTRHQTPDPLAYFTAARALGVKAADLYGLLMPEVPKPDREKAAGGDGEAEMDAGRHASPTNAKRVESVALVTGVLHADADGIARFDLPVGRFAGKLRLMAVAYTGTDPAGATARASKFGSADANTLVRSPVMVQSSWPRFAAPGDRFVVPLTVFNGSGSDGIATVRVMLDAAAGGKPPVASADGRATIEVPALAVPAGKDATVFVDVAAGQAVGVARVRVEVAMNGERFTESLELPVRPAAPELTEGGFVAATPAAAAKVAPPDAVLDGTRQLQVRVTPWPSLNLPKGLQYLERYPYGCAEQTTSGAFPLVALADLGERLDPGTFDRERVGMKVQAGVLRLMGMQTADGGLGMWPGARESWPWASVYAAHFLVEAQAAGHAVPDDFRDRLLGYCRGLLDEASSSADRVQAQAYACYVLSLAGKPPRASMSRLTDLLDRTTRADQQDDPEWHGLQTGTARSHLAMAWLAAGRRDLAGAMVPKVLPNAAGPRRLGGNLASPVRDQAVLLSAMIAVSPDAPEVAGLAQRLADAGAKGEWRSTQETAVALCALGRYVRAVGKAPAYDHVELWAAGQKLAEADGGKPLAWDVPKGGAVPKDLEVRVGGAKDARAFVTWLQHGVPTAPPAAADNGMQVRRAYTDKDGKPVDPAKLASGDLVRVELTLTTPAPLQNVVIDDLLPAGLEVENARLESGAAVAAVAGPRGRRGRDDRLEPNAFNPIFVGPRDDRMVVVGHVGSAGTWRFSYLARAVSPGEFVAPPVRAECMYDPG
ncbi:MAG TPA: alpha-2-macroglobulin family protein, partial [Humisphaera sp.]